MKIAIEATPLMSRSTGIERFVYCILDKLAGLDKENEYILYYHGGAQYGKRIPPEFDFKKGKYKVVRIPLQILNFLRDYLKFPPLEIFIGKPDVFWSTNYQIPVFWSRTKIINTIYDLSSFIYPHYYTNSLSRIKKKMPEAVQKADIIVTVSKNTKKDIHNIFKAPLEKIRVVYCGVSEEFFNEKDEKIRDETRIKYANSERFILSVGTLSPRKNFVNLIKAFKIIKSRFPDIKLVIAGQKGWLFEDIFSSVKNLGLEKDVIFTGVVSNEELNFLYNCAEVFAFPSFYEGFGIPVAEAMKCGAPICCSNTSSMPEIAGDAALYFNPNDKDEIAQLILRLLQDKSLKEELVKEGFKQVKNFLWEKSAQQVLDIFKSI